MDHVTNAGAKAHLGDLVARAEVGKIIHIGRHGKPVAQTSTLMQPGLRIDLARLRSVTDTMAQSAAESVLPAMRDEARY
jgi:antitoxin (DNA-binding transcriptional repressor) of toxin-antitoxin stability system